MFVDSNYTSVITGMLQQAGYHNLVVQQAPAVYDYHEHSCKFMFGCKICPEVYHVKVNYNEINGSPSSLLDVLWEHIKHYGKQHLHLPTVQDPTANEPVKLYNYPLYYKTKAAPVDVKTSFYPGVAIPVKDANDIHSYPYINVSGMGSVGTGTGPVTLSQELLKEIYKLSNFNVEPQVRRKPYSLEQECRANCVNCGETIYLNVQEIGNTNSSTWNTLREFCQNHRHGGVTYTTSMEIEVEVERTGRKFKI